jgi:hypothetical protein
MRVGPRLDSLSGLLLEKAVSTHWTGGWGQGSEKDLVIEEILTLPGMESQLPVL